MKLTLAAATAALGFGSTAYAQSIAKVSLNQNIQYALNIPDATAQSGNGDIFFQIVAPTSYSWVALGQGHTMKGSNIFVMYTSGDGNVTVSTRIGTGFVEPEHTTDAQIMMLPGSGVQGNMMTANVKCSNCNSWPGGSMDFTADSASWIHTFKTGSPIDSTDLNVEIEPHIPDDGKVFTFSLADAKGGNDANPFLSSNATQTPATAISGSSDEPQANLILAHGALAAVAFVAIFPTGGILIRVASFTGLVWVHAALQILGLVLFIVAFGLGVYVTKQLDNFSHSHPIIGVVLLALLLIQPITGLLHHRMFSKHSKRTLSSYEHLGIGRIAIIIGMANGGNGLHFAEASTSSKIAYGVCAGFMGVAYIASIIYGESKRRRGGSNHGGDEKAMDNEYDLRQQSHQLESRGGDMQERS